MRRMGRNATRDDPPFASVAVSHQPSRRDGLEALIADCLGDLAGVHCAGGDSLSDLRQRLVNLNDRDLWRLAAHLQAAVEALV